MKKQHIFLAAGLAALAAGCASERVTADYTMPAKAVANVGAVSLLDIVSKAELSGNRVSDGDAARAAELVRRQLSAHLYQEGFYRTTDSVWGGEVKGAAALRDVNSELGSRHGYAAFYTESPEATGRLELSLSLAVDAERIAKTEQIELETVPYVDLPQKDKYDEPRSTPNPDTSTYVKRSVEVKYDVWKVTGSGSLAAKLFDAKTGEAVYERTFDVAPPDDNPHGEPTLLRAVSVAVDGAIRDIVADISPHRESRSLEVNESAHPRVVALLAAKDFVDAVSEVEALEEAKLSADPKDKSVYVPVAADFENKAVALEVIGDYDLALHAYRQALSLEPGNAAAQEGVARIESVKSGAAKIKESGASKNAETQFKKDAVSQKSL